MVSGAYYIPKKRPGSTVQGEDAYFLCEQKDAIGVADGVGGWILEGVDAGEYARQLMNNAFEAILSMKPDDGNVDDRMIVKRVLDQAFSKTKVKGSSTACIIKLIDNVRSTCIKLYTSPSIFFNMWFFFFFFFWLV